MCLLIIDGNSILNRSFFGIKNLMAKSGTPTNAIYGFLTSLEKFKKDLNPTSVAIAFDMKDATFRHKEYSDYKKNRKGMPQELYVQLPILKKLLTTLGYKIIEKSGFEADDILGTLSFNCGKSSKKCIIATGDRDSLQLINKNTCVYLACTKKGKSGYVLFDESKIMEEFGVDPEQLIQVKALQGDTSDNIPGVPGIGAKRALDLIKQFGNIQYIYSNLENLNLTPSLKAKLLNGKDLAFLSLKLGTILKDVPISKSFEDYIPKAADIEKVKNILEELQMFSLKEKLGIN